MESHVIKAVEGNRAGFTTNLKSLFLAPGQLPRMFHSYLETSSDCFGNFPKFSSQLVTLENVRVKNSHSPEIYDMTNNHPLITDLKEETERRGSGVHECCLKLCLKLSSRRGAGGKKVRSQAPASG